MIQTQILSLESLQTQNLFIVSLVNILKLAPSLESYNEIYLSKLLGRLIISFHFTNVIFVSKTPARLMTKLALLTPSWSPCLQHLQSVW